MNDSVSSKQYFENAIVIYQRSLDTLKKDTTNAKYESALTNKAVNMILAGQEEEGRAILKRLVAQERTRSRMGIGRMVYQILEKSKQEIIDSFLDY